MEDIRQRIDDLDRDIVALIANRGACVARAAHFKKDSNDVKAPQRVEQVIEKVRSLSKELGADPDLVEQVYRTMIREFIKAELTEHRSI